MLALPAFVALLSLCATGVQYVAALIYGLSLLLSYTSSALYHGLNVTGRMLTLFQRIDRSAIYLFIAGTVTPVALLNLGGWEGWFLFVLIWTFALTGIVLTAIIPFRNVESTLLYLSMGWITLFFLRPLFDSMSTEGFIWCVVGGLLYTLGAIVYVTDWPNPSPPSVGSHEVWHVLCLLGSVSHFIMIVGYVL